MVKKITVHIRLGAVLRPPPTTVHDLCEGSGWEEEEFMVVFVFLCFHENRLILKAILVPGRTKKCPHYFHERIIASAVDAKVNKPRD